VYKWHEVAGEMYVLASDWSPLSPSIYGHKYKFYKSLLIDYIFLNLGFVSPCIFVHSNELIQTRCSN